MDPLQLIIILNNFAPPRTDPHLAGQNSYVIVNAL